MKTQLIIYYYLVNSLALLLFIVVLLDSEATKFQLTLISVVSIALAILSFFIED